MYGAICHEHVGDVPDAKLEVNAPSIYQGKLTEKVNRHFKG